MIQESITQHIEALQRALEEKHGDRPAALVISTARVKIHFGSLAQLGGDSSISAPRAQSVAELLATPSLRKSPAKH